MGGKGSGGGGANLSTMRYTGSGGGGNRPAAGRQAATGEGQPRSYEGGPSKSLSPTAKKRMTNAGKWGAGGLLTGSPALAFLSAMYGAAKNPWPGTKGGSGVMERPDKTNPRAEMKGVPAGQTYPTFSRFGPQDLLVGSDNDSGSLLGGNDDDEGFGGYGAGL